MKLKEFQSRRARLLEAQRLWQLDAVSIGNLQIRDAPTSEPGTGFLSVTRLAEGGWRGDRWYSEPGGTHSISEVVAESFDKAIDWAWWVCTADYLSAFVRPSEEQRDRERKRLLQRMLQLGFKDNPKQKALFRRARRPRWSDESSASMLLGLAARILARSSSPTVMRLARNAHTPPWALAKLALSDTPGIRWQVAGNPSTSARDLLRLRDSGDFGVRWYLALREETATSDIVEWSMGDPALWSIALGRRDISAQQIESLDRASSGALRPQIIKHSASSTELLNQFSAECDPRLGLILLESNRLAPDRRDALVTRICGGVERLFPSDLTGHLLPLGSGLTARLLLSDGAQERMLAAASSGLSAEDFGTLAADSSTPVREVLAASPCIPQGTLAQVSSDPSMLVRRVAMRNSAMAASTLSAIACDASHPERLRAVSDLILSEATLELLVHDSDQEVANQAKSQLARRHALLEDQRGQHTTKKKR